MGPARVVHVAVAVIRDDVGRVLCTQRLPHQHLAGMWEFPGGKLEPGESLIDGLRREIHEELGLEVDAVAPLLRVQHAYPGKTVLLDVWRVTRWRGQPHGREGQPLRWLHPDDMRAAEFPPADVPIIAALRLPPRYAISPDIVDRAGMEAFVARAARAGASLVQVRLKTAPWLAVDLVRALKTALPDVRVLANSDSPAEEADGIHLTAHALMACTEKPATLCAASCHDARELQRAYELGLDFVTLSPVLATASHPEAAALGWERFAVFVRNAGVPVYALGGMRLSLLRDAMGAGAVGIAGIGAILD